jgi:carbon monoxide dehydrogenase subunit G
MDLSATTTIDRTPEEIFEFISNVRNDTQWRTGVVESGLRSDPPIGSGAVGFARAGKIETVYRITTFEPPRRVDWEFIGGPIHGRGGYRLESAGSGTRFTLVADVAPSGVMRLLGPLFGRIGRRQNQRDVETLREILKGSSDPSNGQPDA